MGIESVRRSGIGCQKEYSSFLDAGEDGEFPFLVLSSTPIGGVYFALIF
jgi:hypothetical protein